MPRKKVEPHKVNRRGKDGWCVIIPKDLGGGRKFFDTRKAADDFAQDQEKLRRGKSHRILALPVADLNSIATALDKIGWSRVHEIVDAATLYAENKSCATKPLSAVITECVESKRLAGCRARYVDALQSSLKRFEKSAGADTQFNVLGRQDVEKFIYGVNENTGKPVSPWTSRARLTDAGTLFSFAMNRNYARENPVEKMDAIRLDSKAPGILTVEQAGKLLTEVRAKWPELIPYLAICLFGGLRSAEAEKVDWSNIPKNAQGEFEYIQLSSSQTKGRQRRLVTVNETLRAWLNLGGTLPVTEATFRKVRSIVTPWPKNCLRHSFVSYHFAIHGAASTAREAGHSEQMLHQHYKELVTKTAAETFWKLKPL